MANEVKKAACRREKMKMAFVIEACKKQSTDCASVHVAKRPEKKDWDRQT